MDKEVSLLVRHIDMITGLNIKNQRLYKMNKRVKLNQKLKVKTMIVMMTKSQNNYINILKNIKNKKKLRILLIMLNKIFNYRIK